MGKGASECEFCGLFKVFSGEDTVCRDCDTALKVTQEFEAKARAQAWALRNRCRRCGDGLALGRYFECEACLPDADRETHCPFYDGPEPIGSAFDGVSINGQLATVRAAQFTEPKKCNRCGETKPRDQFYFNKSMKDGRFNHCNKCHNKANARYKQEAKEGVTV